MDLAGDGGHAPCYEGDGRVMVHAVRGNPGWIRTAEAAEAARLVR